ncbi:hypothetical protein [Paractinoplanes lichenicola]|uniref:Secreted protein n=1 Tax=Paractinoplanes lichenicola TaxID=2802976 RepID=A0ABS1W0Q4_9ACTN|nr:hypothetical protein [Actinoplanes lichenicola]MBL7260289.1 hypothetical protein [Actinoplanes lichenicola]
MRSTALLIRRLLTVIALTCAAVLTPMAASTASAVSAFEWDYTVNGSGIGYQNCTFVVGSSPSNGVTGCFHPDGDKFWVEDSDRDGVSAALYWSNYNSDGSLYRHGACVEKRGVGESGWCNKNFREGTTLRIRACFYDVPTGVRGKCNSISNYITV